MAQETMRQKLIDAIFDMAGDEIETVQDAKSLQRCPMSSWLMR